MELFYILLIDSDPVLAGQIVEYFNPPMFYASDLVTSKNKAGNKTKPYQFVFIYCRTFKKALQTLIAHNGDPYAKERNLPCIDTILFEIKENTRGRKEKFSYWEFLQEIHQLGMQRLKLKGLLAQSPFFSESLKDELTWYGVRGFLRKPFTLEQLEEYLQKFSHLVNGSTTFFIEPRSKATSVSHQTQIQRVLRYYNRFNKLAGISLPPLLEERKPDGTTIISLQKGEVELEDSLVSTPEE
ncbi:hypothetical protein PCC7424_5637 (plasmid) [Gloeothece citriformis PCC 7424]|uniref:Uncharacterized protein n=1 Tax=Gloeothece citriformis (strain PCC 7424) TaxID=65393 RepID=B7KLP1_GLOC7|nr:hypothetical protein [Gloeothece citriformis]ACK73713.1 hypothetical protein PCC7424_5637 [Gloeothece citriformis PCC 7424]